MRHISHIVIHCSAGNSEQSTTSILNYWRNVLGWKTVGYHYIINKDGTIEKLASEQTITNGVKGYNANSIHVCYKGGLNGKDTRTPQQKESLLNIIKGLKIKYPNAKVKGHRDFSKDINGDGKITSADWIKLCPAFDAKAEYNDI